MPFAFFSSDPMQALSLKCREHPELMEPSIWSQLCRWGYTEGKCSWPGNSVVPYHT